MPGKGRVYYELKFGPQAKALLTQANEKKDPALLDQVAMRYFHTKAGREAHQRLSSYHLENGSYFTALLCYEKLLKEPEELPAETLFKAAKTARILATKIWPNEPGSCSVARSAQRDCASVTGC